jgi:hypothetical protein
LTLADCFIAFHYPFNKTELTFPSKFTEGIILGQEDTSFKEPFYRLTPAQTMPQFRFAIAAESFDIYFKT